LSTVKRKVEFNFLLQLLKFHCCLLPTMLRKLQYCLRNSAYCIMYACLF